MSDAISELPDGWPWQQAQAVIDRLETSDDDGPIIFETGFGPSGLPHLGHFAENARTTFVRRAFHELSDRETKLVVFSDDMDGLRKVPQGIPRAGMLEENLGKPLSAIPDPYGEESTFAAYMNARLREFLDQFDFDYEFRSSRQHYERGDFDDGLRQILHNYEAVRDVVTAEMREENREAWSPFFPVCEECGKVYTTRVTEIHPDDGEISYACDDDSFRNIPSCGHSARQSVGGGNVKVGWKVDWALRWYTFGVDYEMYGKDLIESADLSSEICRILGGDPPVGYFYEMFLDENGQKISSSRGGGFGVDDWLTYAPLESLAWFVQKSPQKATKIHADMVPRAVDDWLDGLRDFDDAESAKARRSNPVYLIEKNRLDAGETPADIGMTSDITYQMLLNVIGALNVDEPELVWQYVERYDERATEDRALIDRLIDDALTYYEDRILPDKEYRQPPEEALPAIQQFREFLENNPDAEAETIQNQAYQAGKDHDLSLGDWFQSVYRLLLGQDQGPRVGTFVDMIGIDETIDMIDERIDESN